MKTLFAILFGAALGFLQAPAHAQPRHYQQAELDALLAPVALYPDPLLSQVLVAATYPQDVHEAAAWSRANPQLKGEEAVRAAQSAPWDASVKSLLAYPELLSRMDESPQWTADLGAAFLMQEPQVMDTVQALRRRAQASGHLQSNDQYAVQQHGGAIAVLPARPNVIFVRYYDPYVVYGPWWWPHYRPVYWRPWRHHVVHHVHYAPASVSINWHHRNVVRPVHVHRPVQVQRQVHIHNHVHQAQNAKPIVQGARLSHQAEQRRHSQEHKRHEAHRRSDDRKEHQRHGREDRKESKQHHRDGRG